MLVITRRLLRLMDAMPSEAAVPRTVAMTAEMRATSSETRKALRMAELWNRLVYHLKVKPVNSA